MSARIGRRIAGIGGRASAGLFSHKPRHPESNPERHLDWILPGYPSNTCSPGGAIVFELRQSQSTGEYIIRASYIGQTLDQLRNLTPLTLAAPPASAPLFIPGCSQRNATFDCRLTDFVRISNQVIDPRSADLVN